MGKGARVLARSGGIQKARRFPKGLTRMSKRQRNKPNFPGEPPYELRGRVACSMYIRCKDLRNRKRGERECANWFGVLRPRVHRRLCGV